MTQRGVIRNFYPGGNTCNGFHSFYDHIIKTDATRIFSIKGGPGVGKSTFMKWIGAQMQERGYDIEFHWCSSDNSSLDGVVIPALQIALMDGTAPHIVDPKNPGAVDEIIHLGDYWNDEAIREPENRQSILTSNARVGRLFKMAYAHLREAKTIMDEWESYTTEATDFGAVNRMTDEIITAIFSEVQPNFTATGSIRRLFGSAITPKGPVNHYESIMQGVETLYAIKGAPGTGKSTLISRVLDRATMLGLKTEAYHCSLDPSKLDGLVIPELKMGLLNVTELLDFTPSKLPNLKAVRAYNLSLCLNAGTLSKYHEELASAQQRFWEAFNRSWGFVAKAKAEHDVMEQYYIPHMDFEAIDKRRNEVLSRILKYAEEM